MPKTSVPSFFNISDLTDDEAQNVVNKVQKIVINAESDRSVDVARAEEYSTKVCSQCNQEKERNQFHKDKSSKDGLQYKCKACRSYNNYIKAEIKRLNSLRLETKNGRVLLESYNSQVCGECDELKWFDEFTPHKKGKYGYYTFCKECAIVKNKRWADNNSDKVAKTQKKSYRKHRKKRIAENKKFFEENPDYRRNYAEANREYIREQKRVANARLYNENENYRISQLLTKRIREVLNGSTKTDSTRELTGCSYEKLKQHLESQFEDGMSWENQGEWHIDHIIPCSAFDLIDNEYTQAVCFHYSNLQPLWAEDNMIKGNSIPDLGITIDKEFLEQRGCR